MNDKKSLSERDICTKFITPAVEKSGWNKLTQLLEEVSFTDGKIYVRGKLTARGERKRADYILYYKPHCRRNREAIGKSQTNQAAYYSEPANHLVIAQSIVALGVLGGREGKLDN